MVGQMWYVYILKSSIKRWYYVGSTNRFDQRIKEHNLGKVLSTKAYKPLQLIFKREFGLEKEARNYERLLKDKRIEKERIIRLFESN
jgi:putative endonuclease